MTDRYESVIEQSKGENPVQPNEHISQANSAIHENLSRLDMTIANLIKRISVTLVAEPTDAVPSDSLPKPPRSPLADDLWDANDRLFLLTGTLQRITDRIDI